MKYTGSMIIIGFRGTKSDGVSDNIMERIAVVLSIELSLLCPSLSLSLLLLSLLNKYNGIIELPRNNADGGKCKSYSQTVFHCEGEWIPQTAVMSVPQYYISEGQSWAY